MRPRESLVIPGVVLFALGALLFFVSKDTEVRIGFMPFTTLLITAFVGGAILSIVGLVALLADRL